MGIDVERGEGTEQFDGKLDVFGLGGGLEGNGRFLHQASHIRLLLVQQQLMRLRLRQLMQIADERGQMLRLVISPVVGGDTLFCSMTAAFAGLSPRMQHYLSGLTAVHDFKPFRTLFANRPEKRAQLRQMEDDYPNPSHPVVRHHPVSGRPILNVNPQFTTLINDIPADESEMLLAFLYAQAKKPEYQLRVQWQPHMMVMWDNRSTQHYASHDYYPQRRRMLRITVEGEAPFGIADRLADIAPIATLEERREGLKSEIGEMVTRESERQK